MRTAFAERPLSFLVADQFVHNVNCADQPAEMSVISLVVTQCLYMY